MQGLSGKKLVMLLPLKCICEKKNVRRNGTSIVYIQYCLSSSKRTQLNTEIEIPPEYWDHCKQIILGPLPAKYGTTDQLNAELKRMFRVAEDIIEFALRLKMADPGKFAKSIFTPELT